MNTVVTLEVNDRTHNEVELEAGSWSRGQGVAQSLTGVEMMAKVSVLQDCVNAVVSTLYNTEELRHA